MVLIMYFLKLFHIGHPLVTLPTTMLVPLAVFFGIVYGGGWTLADARESGWFFEEFDAISFYKQWTSFQSTKVVYSEVFILTGEILVMVMIVTTDALLKLVSRDRAIIDLLRMEQGSRIFMDSMADIEDQTHLQCCQPMVLYIQNHLKIHADGSVIVLYGSVMVL